MKFGSLADMHIHTEYSHDCDTSLVSVKHAARKHDMMVAIADHNEIRGVLAARAMRIPVIPAIEVTTKKLHDYLLYFETVEDLKTFFSKHVKPRKDPGKIWGSRTTITDEELVEVAHEHNAFISLAHPYCPLPKRSANIPKPVLRKVDAIEVMNFAMSPKANQKAALLCDSNKKVYTAGSDSHHPSTLGAVTMRAWGETPQEFLTEVRQGTPLVVGAPRKTKDVFDKVAQFVAYKATH